MVTLWRPSIGVRLLFMSVLVLVLALALVRNPASGADPVPSPRVGLSSALPLTSPLPSIEQPLPSVEVLPPIDLGTPLPSASLPLPSASLPLPSASLPLPSASLPLPSLSPGPLSSLTASSAPSVLARPTDPTSRATTRLNESSSPEPFASSTPDASEGGESGRPREGLAGGSRGRPPAAGQGRSLPASSQPNTELPSWLVPSLVLTVPVLLVVAAVLAQVAGGATVLGVARRLTSRVPGPIPRWMRGASDALDGS